MPWRTDWDNAPKDESKFLVLLKDGNVTTGYFWWCTEGGEEGFKSIAFWSLHDAIRDEPLDEDGPPEDNGLEWMVIP